MKKETLKKAFSHAANAGLAFAGGAAFLAVPLFGVLTVALTGAGAQEQTLGGALLNLPTEIQAVTAGMMAASAAVCAVGYSRVIGNVPGAKKGAVAHTFNMTAVTLGATTALVGAASLGQGDLSIAPFILAAGGAGMFCAGYTRQFGQHKPTPTPGV